MDSVRFACQPGCIRCCEQNGHIYLSEDDVKRAAKFVGMKVKTFEAKYIYRTANEIRFRKPQDKQCSFLNEHGCTIHPAKPTQCRTFPYWPELVERPVKWFETARYCPGIGKGELIQIGTALEMADENRTAYPNQYK